MAFIEMDFAGGGNSESQQIGIDSLVLNKNNTLYTGTFSSAKVGSYYLIVTFLSNSNIGTLTGFDTIIKTDALTYSYGNSYSYILIVKATSTTIGLGTYFYIQELTSE